MLLQTDKEFLSAVEPKNTLKELLVLHMPRNYFQHCLFHHLNRDEMRLFEPVISWVLLQPFLKIDRITTEGQRMCSKGRLFQFHGISDEAHHSVLEATSISGTVGVLVETFWEKIEATENQKWGNFVLNFQKKKVEPKFHLVYNSVRGIHCPFCNDVSLTFEFRAIPQLFSLPHIRAPVLLFIRSLQEGL